MIAQLLRLLFEVSVDASAFVFGPLANLEMMSQVFPIRVLFLRLWPYLASCFFRSFPHFSIILEYSVGGETDGLGNDSVMRLSGQRVYGCKRFCVRAKAPLFKALYSKNDPIRNVALMVEEWLTDSSSVCHLI